MLHGVTTILQSILWVLVHLTTLAGRFTILGQENLKLLPNGRGLIVVSNHRTLLDPLFLGASLPFFSPLRPLYFISRPSDGYKHLALGFLFGGLLFKIFGGYPVFKGEDDYRLALRNPLALLAAGRSVCIFPEGGIPDDGTLGPARRGVRYLAEYSGSVILPAALSYRKATGYTVRLGTPFFWNGETHEEIFERSKHLFHEI